MCPIKDKKQCYFAVHSTRYIHDFIVFCLSWLYYQFLIIHAPHLQICFRVASLVLRQTNQTQSNGVFLTWYALMWMLSIHDCPISNELN